MTSAAPSLNRKVLLVEDNPHNRKIFAGMLTHAGFVVIEAIDGQEALDAARQDGVDLILMDLSIPVIDGWECTRRLKSDVRTRNIPGNHRTHGARRAWRRRSRREAGCDGYLSKPISPKKVVEEVKRHLKIA